MATLEEYVKSELKQDIINQLDE